MTHAARMTMTEDPPTQTNSLASFFAGLTSLRPEQVTAFLMEMRRAERERVAKTWGEFGLPHQREPLLAQSGAPWTTWLILGGRGAGKTRAGAEWVRAQARDPAARIALIGEIERDVREVMVEGVSGVLSVHEELERPDWSPSRGIVTWSNGAIAQ